MTTNCSIRAYKGDNCILETIQFEIFFLQKFVFVSDLMLFQIENLYNSPKYRRGKKNSETRDLISSEHWNDGNAFYLFHYFIVIVIFANLFSIQLLCLCCAMVQAMIK